MIPLRDNIPSRTTPFVNYTMIAICAMVFLLQASAGEQGSTLVERYGMIPARVIHPNAEVMVRDARTMQTPLGVRVQEFTRPAAPAGVAPVLTLLTCIFLHGGLMHFLGNMWFLFIFGDNVEDRMGHGGYLIFYLASGVLASLAHLVTDPSSTMPTIGASGAIAGVMGAYFRLYPKAMVVSAIPIFVFIEMVVLPAPVFLGIWFVLQLFQGFSTQAAGVAWWAHIGGFVVGMLVALILDKTHHLRPKVDEIRPHTDHVTAYQVFPPPRRGY